MTENEYQKPIATEEEKSWIKLLASGKQTKEVADEIKMPAGTFAYKLSLLRSRFQCTNTASLIAFFAKNNLID